MSTSVGSSAGNDNQAALEEQRKKQQEEAARQAEEANASSSTDSSEQTKDSENPNPTTSTETQNDSNLDINRPGSSSSSETEESSQTLRSSREASGQERTPEPGEIKPESLREFEAALKTRIDQLKENTQNPTSSEQSQVSEEILTRAPQLLRVDQRQEETKKQDQERQLRGLEMVQEEAISLMRSGQNDKAETLMQNALEDPSFLSSFVAEQNEEKWSERQQRQNINHRVSDEIKTQAKESRDIIQARDLLIQANKPGIPSQQEKDLYTQAMEAMLSGNENLSDYMLANLRHGNLDEAQKAYQENLEDLSPEQKLQKMQTLHTAKITENARQIEAALEREREVFNDRLTDLQVQHRAVENCADCHADTNTNIGFSLMDFENKAQTRERMLNDILNPSNESTSSAFEDLLARVKDSDAGRLELSRGSELFESIPTLSEGIDQRAGLLDIQNEATMLAQAGKTDMAAALLSGDLSLAELEKQKLEESNPYADRLTKTDGTEMSDQEMVTLEREQLENLINQNRMAMAQLEAQMNSSKDTIQRMPLGDDRPAMLERQALLEVQQRQIARQTQRLFQAHDRVTELVNSGDLSGARDILEGRDSILAEGQEPEAQQSPEILADRQFTRTQEEEAQFQETRSVLNALNRQQANQEILEGGVERNLRQTRQDLKENSGWIARWGGLTEQLQNQRDLESSRLSQFERQRQQVSQLQDAARSLVTQGKYDEATELLEKTIDFSSENFRGANTAMIKSYQKINEELGKFDQKFKEQSLTVAKHVTIGAVAIGTSLALAPATGGLSLGVAATMIGGGTLAGYGAGLAIDLVDDAVVDTMVFGDSFEESFKGFGMKQLDNLQTAFTASTSVTGGTGMSRFLTAPARGFGPYSAAGLSALSSAPVTSTINLGFDRAKAEIQYSQLTQAQRDSFGSKEKFLAKQGLDATGVIKRLTVDTGTEVLGSLIGVKIDKIFRAGKTAAGELTDAAADELRRSVTRELSQFGLEASSDIALGVVAEYLSNPQGITSQGLAQNIVQAIAGRKIGEFTAQSFENRRSMPDLNGVRESQSLLDGVEAQTTVRYDNDGNLLGVDVDARPELIQRAQEGDSEARAKLREEAAIHAMQKPIDPLNTPDGKPMPENQYLALRAQRELQSKSVAKALQAEAEGTSPTRTANDEALVKINNEIAAGNFDEALKIAQENGINQTYLDQYGQDYERNSNSERQFIQETNYSANEPDPNTTKLTAIQELSAQDEISSESLGQLKEKIAELDFNSLSDDQKQQIETLSRKLKAKRVNDIALLGELGFLSGTSIDNASQIMAMEVDHAFTQGFETSGRDPNFIKNYFENDLGPRMEAQAGEIKQLLADGADDASIKAAFEKFHLLAAEKNGVMTGHVMNTFNAEGYEPSRTLDQVDSFYTSRLVEDYGYADASEIRPEVQSFMDGIELGNNTRSQRIDIDFDSIRANDNLPDGVQAQTTTRFNNDGEAIGSEVQARPDLIERAKNGDSEALAILREEAEAHGKDKPIDPLKKSNGDPRENPLSQDAYMALRAQRELAMRAKGKALQAQSEGSSVSATKQKTKDALRAMNEQIRAGNFKEALKIAEANGIDQTYRNQYENDYKHNRDPDRTHLEQTDFSVVNDYNELTNIADKSDIEGLRKSVEEDTSLSEQERADLQETINQREKRIKLDEENQTISDLLKEKGLENDPRLAPLAKDPTTPRQAELRRILLDESVTGNDAIIRNSLLDPNDKIRALAEDVIGFDSESRQAATLLLGSDPAKAVQVADLRSVINSGPGATLNFNASARIHTQLSKLGLIVDSKNNILKNKAVQSIIGENYPSKADLADINAKVAKRNPKWGDRIGAIHEMRAHIALERMVANGDIRSFVMAENVVNKYPETGRYDPRRSIGLDALGIDVLIVRNNGDIVPGQIKSSDTGVRGNFTKEVPYIDSSKNQLKIERRWNNPFDATDLTLTQIQHALDNPRPGNGVVTVTDPNSLPAGAAGSQVVIDGTTFGELNLPTGVEIGTIRDPVQMSILEAAIIRTRRADPNAR